MSQPEDIETELPEDGSVFTRGYISREYTAWCGKCGNWEQVAEEQKSRAEKIFRQRGWSNTTARGWLCKVCKPA